MPPFPKESEEVETSNSRFQKPNGKMTSKYRDTDGNLIESGSSLYKSFDRKVNSHYPPTPQSWLAAKRKLDDLGGLWRVHDKLYDLDKFVDKHPGGKDWIALTKGTDITEAFESSHLINVDRVESVLAKYYMKDTTEPRKSPYTFREDGFYKTLKKRVEPLLKKVGTGPTRKCLLIQDSLAVGFITLSLLGAWTGSIILQIVSGLVLGMCITAAHNFLHMKDTWRRFYFDLAPLTSHDFRITHALSHHCFPNTLMDYEISFIEPFFEFLPTRPKSPLQRYGSLIYAQVLYSLLMVQDVLKRGLFMCRGQGSLHPENFLILLEGLAFLSLAPTILRGFCCWFVTYLAASYWMGMVGLNAGHHHPACFHDGDEPRHEPDFGLCQLDATLDKADEFHKTELAVLTAFGEHPLHHLFPSLCHSKLPLIKPIFVETLEEFLEKNRYASQFELFLGTHRQLARTVTLSVEERKNCLLLT